MHHTLVLYMGMRVYLFFFIFGDHVIKLGERSLSMANWSTTSWVIQLIERILFFSCVFKSYFLCPGRLIVTIATRSKLILRSLVALYFIFILYVYIYIVYVLYTPVVDVQIGSAVYRRCRSHRWCIQNEREGNWIEYKSNTRRDDGDDDGNWRERGSFKIEFPIPPKSPVLLLWMTKQLCCYRLRLKMRIFF